MNIWFQGNKQFPQNMIFGTVIDFFVFFIFNILDTCTCIYKYVRLVNYS